MKVAHSISSCPTPSLDRDHSVFKGKEIRDAMKRALFGKSSSCRANARHYLCCLGRADGRLLPIFEKQILAMSEYDYKAVADIFSELKPKARL